jgi:3-hydroxyisobutyrate dehydrogenase-like beta-hydroxyacid dehydrogenase
MIGNAGFIGLGTMGFPMAANLAKAGITVHVHDSDAGAMQRAALVAGMHGAASPQEVAAKADVLFTCLPTNEIVLGVYLGSAGIGAGGKPGLVTCDCSTVSPETTMEVAKALKSKGVTHLDTPMLGSSPQAVEGQVFFIVGGDPAALAKAEPYLKIMGKLHMHVGSSGTGNVVKLIHNGLGAATSVAVAEALALAVQAGVDPGTFTDVVRNGGGMAYGTYFERRAQRIFSGEFSPTFMLDLMRKDVALDSQLARRLRVPTPMLDETLRTYDEASAAGWGREDFSAVTHVIEKRIGRALSRK